MTSRGLVRERVAQRYLECSAAERKVADALLRRPWQTAELPIDRLAQEIGVGTSVISRFVRRVGFADMRALRLALALDLGAATDDGGGTPAGGGPAEAQAPNSAEQAVQDAARAAASDDIEAIRTNLAALDSRAVAAAAALVADAPRIVTVGVNSSGAAAERLSMMLRRRGWRARCENTPADPSWTSDLDAGDLVVAVTHRGTTEAIVAALPGIRARRAHLIAVTNAPEVEIGRQADVVLATAIAGGATDDRYEVDPVFIVQIVTLRALVAAAVAARDHDQKED